MFLDVGDGHKIYYREFGVSTGKPVIVLHGGPGGGMQRSALKYFNQKRWRIIMFDQRGCGRSTPSLSLHKNTTWDLVTDIEKLREVCDVQKWTVFGGSWGSTLALAYADKHMDRITALVLRGVCLLEPWETDWLYGPNGAARLYPEAWNRFVTKAAGGKSSMTRRLNSQSRRTRKVAADQLFANPRTRTAVAKAWWDWEAALSFLRPKADNSSEKEVQEISILEHHYFTHNAWLRPGQLLAAAKRIPKSVPLMIVQGRYDLVCPAASAVKIAEAVPHAKLHMTISGHAASDPENAAALRTVFNTLSK